MVNEATLAQNRASDPGRSTWLGANAGSGKTRVLTDRVARLLLDGVPPERILCLTYTKAAAMEMQNRLFEGLGEWAMTDDEALRATLTAKGVQEGRLNADILARARTLFARAIEAPGGLKIQTIHSFCASVLRRFPLEAGVSPAFKEIDERTQSRLLADLMDEIAESDEGRIALAEIAPYLSDDGGLISIGRSIAALSEELREPAGWEAICAACDISPDLSEAELLEEVFGPFDPQIVSEIRKHFDPELSSTKRLYQAFGEINWSAPGFADLKLLEGVLLTGATAKIPFEPKVDKIANAGIRKAIGAHMEPLNALIERVAEARLPRIGLLTARKSFAFHRFAAQFLDAYHSSKLARGWLDFDDLILGMNRLLQNKDVAQWVLFRLDGGIDHILVDEAQDTSPRQWNIISKLAEDFAAGEGARAEVERTIFVVGDKKQSIYSFQGADPAEFDRMRAHFEEQLRNNERPLQDAELVHSFRSAPAILQLVDRVAHGLGKPGLGDGVSHISFFDQRPGRVDLWPHIEASTGAGEPEWDDPQDLVGEDHHSSLLAHRIAVNIRQILDAPPLLKNKPVDAGDFLILVRKRSPLFHKIIGELKLAGLPVAGVDRAQLTTPMAVKDLLALCRFLATPEDELSLACVLRSPLCGFDENDLFNLAHGREGRLWNTLHKRPGDFPEAVGMLQDLRDQADYLRPYELLERALTRHDGRRKLIARLGAEAEDAIDAMLAQALQYEATEVPSLTGFVGWLESGDVQVKRDLSKAEGQIRVMTVHGAKGLEAPIVILPDCAQNRPRASSVRLLQPEGAPVLWSVSSGEEPESLAQTALAKQEREQEEANRLLYVALTRAESWLIVAAAGALGSEKNPASSWYKIVENALHELEDLKPLQPAKFEEPGLRFQTGAWETGTPEQVRSKARAILPDWIDMPAAKSVRDAPTRSPSDLGGAKALPGDGDETEIALQRGRIIHLLLEHLPGLPRPEWGTAARKIAAFEAELPASALDPMIEEAIRVLEADELTFLFTPEALAEVEITGYSDVLNSSMHGFIDRLVVTEERVLAVDFKSNTVVPASPEETPEGLLRQMGAYAELLKPVYPGREIRTALLWTKRAELMTLPHDLVSDALKRARNA